MKMSSMSEVLVRKDTKHGNRRVVCWRASGYTALRRQMLGCITAPAGIHCMETLTGTEQKPSHASHCANTHTSSYFLPLRGTCLLSIETLFLHLCTEQGLSWSPRTQFVMLLSVRSLHPLYSPLRGLCWLF